MDKKKKAAPEQGDHPNTQTNHTKIKLSPSQLRIVKYLIKHGSALTFELEEKCYVRYAADIIQYIRKKGISIKTTMEDYYRKDGELGKVGRYSIEYNSIKKAHLAILL